MFVFGLFVCVFFSAWIILFCFFCPAQCLYDGFYLQYPNPLLLPGAFPALNLPGHTQSRFSHREILFLLPKFDIAVNIFKILLLVRHNTSVNGEHAVRVIEGGEN